MRRAGTGPTAPARRWVPVVAVLVSGCVAVDTSTRTERGPLLQRVERHELAPGGLRASVEVDDAVELLTLRVEATDTCRVKTVEVYAEDRVTERRGLAAGPAISTGVAMLLASAALVVTSFLVSDAPDTSFIDRQGNFGPSPAQVARGWAIGTAAVGVPALGVGLVSLSLSGEDVQRVKSEQVVSEREAPCHPRPFTGPVTIAGVDGRQVEVVATEGAAPVPLAALDLEVEDVRAAGRTVGLEEGELVRLDAFSACAREKAARGRQRRELLERCRVLKGAAVDADLEALAGTAEASDERGPARVVSFESAVEAFPPRLVLEPGGADLERLDRAASLEAVPALLRGRVSTGIAENIGVIEVGARRLFVFLPPGRPWTDPFPVGTEVEAVVLLSGEQTLGDVTLPLARAVWMRPRQ